MLTAEVNGATGLPVFAENDLPEQDEAYDYPFGLFDFRVEAPGGVTTVIIELPDSVTIPGDAVVRKQDASKRWVTFEDSVMDYDKRIVTLTLTDNDELDQDATAGIIRDPVGVGVPVTPASVSATADGGGGGGGGCALSDAEGKNNRYDLLMLVLLFLAVGLVRKQGVSR